MIFATSNSNKLREAREILGPKLKSADVDLQEIQSVDVEKIAKHKVMQAYGIVRKPVFVEDVGLYVDGLKGFPGGLVKWTMDGLGYEKFCRLVDLCASRNAYSETCIAFYDGKRLKTFMGRTKGKIAMHTKGKNGFGWDTIFIPKGGNRTFAQMTAEEKRRISHRAVAIRKMALFLKHNGIG